MNTYNLCFKQLNIQQIDAIVQCRDSLIESSFLRETFVKPDTDYLEYILLGAGIMIGVFYDNTLLGFASYVTPSKAKTDLTKFITKNKNNIIQFEHGIIAPKWCIFRKNCASVPEERSAIPLQTEQSSAG